MPEPIDDPKAQREALVVALENCEKGARTVFYAALLATVPFFYILYALITFDQSKFVDVRREAVLARTVTDDTRDFVEIVGGLSQRGFVKDYQLIVQGMLSLQDLPWRSASVSARSLVARRIGLEPDSLTMVMDAFLIAADSFLEIYPKENVPETREQVPAITQFDSTESKPTKTWSFTYDPPVGRYEIVPHIAGVWMMPNTEMQRQMRLSEFEGIAVAMNVYYDHWHRLLSPEVMGTLLNCRQVASGDTIDVPLFLYRGRAETLMDYRELRNKDLPYLAESFCAERGLNDNLVAMELYADNIGRLAESLERNEVGEVQLPLVAESVALPFVFLIGNILLLGLIGAGCMDIVRRRAIIFQLNRTLDPETAGWLELGRHPWAGSVHVLGWTPSKSGGLISIILLSGMAANCVSAGLSLRYVGFRWEAAIGGAVSLTALGCGVMGLSWLWRRGFWKDRIQGQISTPLAGG